MERTISWFEQFGLFKQAAGGAERTDAAAITSVSSGVEQWYDSFWDTALKYCDGDIAKAEQFMDTNVYLYHYRIKQKAAWVEWRNTVSKGQ